MLGFKRNREPSKNTYLIAGLGNPGIEYELSRHNMGFMALDRLSRRWGIPVNRTGFHGQYGQGTVGDAKVILVKPHTYMNDSGRCLSEIISFYRIPMDHVLVLYDDIDLPAGKLRLRSTGSAGTHNGMRSIVTELQEEAFPRLRMGVGKPEHKGALVSYVLGKPTEEEQPIIALMLDRAADSVDCLIRRGFDAAMRTAQEDASAPGKTT